MFISKKTKLDFYPDINKYVEKMQSKLNVNFLTS